MRMKEVALKITPEDLLRLKLILAPMQDSNLKQAVNALAADVAMLDEEFMTLFTEVSTARARIDVSFADFAASRKK